MKDPAVLFDMEAVLGEKPANLMHGRQLERKLWTRHKADLIARYLYYFTFVTKNGVYLDAFAGPQDEDPGKWAAELVIEQRPRWLNRLVFFEKDAEKIAQLNSLRERQPARKTDEKKRTVRVIQGDTNIELPRYLDGFPLRQKNAGFALLDQRTFELEWRTVEVIARAKAYGNKIEQFYFLAERWIKRAASRRKDYSPEKLAAWWGNDDWLEVIRSPGFSRMEMVKQRFASLGYKYVIGLPIYRDKQSPEVMFYMIHASDDKRAPQLMVRAYNRAVRKLETKEQLELDLRNLVP